MKNAGKSVKLRNLEEGAAIYRYTPSLFQVVPKPYLKHFSADEKLKLAFRLLRGYWFYYIADDSELYAYDFIKKDYLNTYTFMNGEDVISNPNYTFPNRRGKGYARIIFRALIEDQTTSWTKLWGVIKEDNIPSIKAATNAGFRFVGYSKKENGKHKLTEEKTELQVFCCERKPE